MKQRHTLLACVLLVLALGLAEARYSNAFLEVKTRLGSQSKTDPTLIDPESFPPAPPSISPVLSVAGGSVVIGQTVPGESVVGEETEAIDPQAVSPDGAALLIRLPPPPDAHIVPDIPYVKECDKETECANAQLLADKRRLTVILKRLRLRQSVLSDYESWLEEAHRALSRVKRQVDTAESNKAVVEEDIARLKQEKEDLMKRTEADRLQRDLRLAKKKMAELQAQSRDLSSARRVIASTRDNVREQIDAVGEKLAMSQDDVEKKIMEFNDVNTELGKIAQEITSVGDS